jgi:TonB family protein
MAPLTKDALETTNSAAEATGSTPGASTKSEQAGHLRADAVSLEVPVKVHGSRVTEVVREVTPHTQPFEEQTSTMIVFPQGAVIRMSTSVNVGQMLVVTNLKTRQDAICRVVKVRTFSNLQGYVEVEFTHKQPGYWSVYFPSEGPAIGSKSAQPAAVEPAPAIKKPPVSSASDISWAPAPPANTVAEKPVEVAPFAAVKPPVVTPQVISPAKPEPSFISIGRQEQVQPAASTITPAPAPPITPKFETLKRAPAQEKADTESAINLSTAPIVEAPSAISSTDLHGTAPAAPAAPEYQFSSDDSAERGQSAAAASDETVRSSFGSLSGGATLNARATSAPEGILGSYTEASSHSKTPTGQNWTLIAACLALLLAAVGAGIFYIRTSNSSAKSNQPAVIQPAPAAQTNLNAPQVPEASVASPKASNPSRGPIANTPPSTIVSGNAAAGSHDASDSSSRPGTTAKQEGPRVTSDMMNATLNSHPVSSQRTVGGGENDAAPSLDAAAEPPASATGALSGAIGSSDVALPPAPEIKPEGPVKIGGLVREPKLLSSTLPIYPTFAKEAHVEGDVVIRTTIDKNGSVTHMEVVSGPTMLRQAALDALGRWKYVPSKLDGQPVSVQMLVTIKFHR